MNGLTGIIAISVRHADGTSENHYSVSRVLNSGIDKLFTVTPKNSTETFIKTLYIGDSNAAVDDENPMLEGNVLTTMPLQSFAFQHASAPGVFRAIHRFSGKVLFNGTAREFGVGWSHGNDYELLSRSQITDESGDPSGITFRELDEVSVTHVFFGISTCIYSALYFNWPYGTPAPERVVDAGYYANNVNYGFGGIIKRLKDSWFKPDNNGITKATAGLTFNVTVDPYVPGSGEVDAVVSINVTNAYASSSLALRFLMLYTPFFYHRVDYSNGIDTVNKGAGRQTAVNVKLYRIEDNLIPTTAPAFDPVSIEVTRLTFDTNTNTLALNGITAPNTAMVVMYGDTPGDLFFSDQFGKWSSVAANAGGYAIRNLPSWEVMAFNRMGSVSMSYDLKTRLLSPVDVTYQYQNYARQVRIVYATRHNRFRVSYNQDTWTIDYLADPLTPDSDRLDFYVDDGNTFIDVRSPGQAIQAGDEITVEILDDEDNVLSTASYVVDNVAVAVTLPDTESDILSAGLKVIGVGINVP